MYIGTVQLPLKVDIRQPWGLWHATRWRSNDRGRPFPYTRYLSPDHTRTLCTHSVPLPRPGLEQAQWLLPAIPGSVKLRQGNCQFPICLLYVRFQGSLGYTSKSYHGTKSGIKELALVILSHIFIHRDFPKQKNTYLLFFGG